MMKKCNRGFTLAETLISILLLTILVVGGMSFYFYSKSMVKLAMHKKLAAQICNAKMEELIWLGYSFLPPSGILETDNIKIGELDGELTTLITDYDLAPLPDGDSVTDYKGITVELTWTESASSKTYSVKLPDGGLSKNSQ